VTDATDGPETTGIVSGRVLVVAFEGWNDAGEAASGALSVLRRNLDVQPIMTIDAEDYFDYQFNRPVVTQDEDGERSIVWPSVVVYGPAGRHRPRARSRGKGEASMPGDNGSNLYLLLGAEPSRKWKSFASEIMQVLREEYIGGIVFLGAMLADVPHTRPISVFASSENPAVRAEFGIEKSNYEGPVGILSVLADAAERLGVPTMSIWASVPHYVHNAPSPKATLALVDRLEDILDVVIPRGDLADEAAVWESGIDALAGDDEDMASYIRQLEQARDTVDSPEASGEAIAQEFERYLRRRGDGGKADGRGPDDLWRP